MALETGCAKEVCRVSLKKKILRAAVLLQIPAGYERISGQPI
jgi:hypothetical protein